MRACTFLFSRHSTATRRGRHLDDRDRRPPSWNDPGDRTVGRPHGRDARGRFNVAGSQPSERRCVLSRTISILRRPPESTRGSSSLLLGSSPEAWRGSREFCNGSALGVIGLTLGFNLLLGIFAAMVLRRVSWQRVRGACGRSDHRTRAGVVNASDREPNGRSASDL